MRRILPVLLLYGCAGDASSPSQPTDADVQKNPVAQPQAQQRVVLPPPTEPRYGATHVLIAWSGAMGASPKVTRSEQEASQLAERLYDRIQNGQSIEQVAVKYSDGPSARRGGRLGVYLTGTMIPDFEAATASVDIGELAPIVKSPFGYHIIRRDGINAVRVSHILLTWSEDGLNGRTREAAVQKAREAQAQLASGTPFKDVVSSFSDEPDAATSKGDLGWITHGQMVPDFENAIMELKVGETSPIVETPDGLHIVHRFE